MKTHLKFLPSIIAALLMACSKPATLQPTTEASPNQSPPTTTHDPVLETALAKARQYLESVSVVDGDFHVIVMLGTGSRSFGTLYQLKNVYYEYSRHSLNEADKLNGLEASYEITVLTKASRFIRDGQWTAWEPGGYFHSFEIVKRNGNWEIIDQMGIFSDYLRNYSTKPTPDELQRTKSA